MRVVIAGAGSVGRSIAQELLYNNHQVLLIDKGADEASIRRVPEANWLAADACEIDALNEAGLADCDAALKKGGRNSAFMDSRGLVLLRMGRLDDAIAQYDAALKLQPKQAWSLYGRGLAKLRRGDVAGGRTDLSAAAALDPGLPQQAQRLGLATEAETKA